MELKNIIFIIVFIASFGFITFSVNNLIKYLKVAKKKDDRFDNIPIRLKRVWNIAFAQTKLLRDPVAGVLHLLIFWGFVLFIFAVLETIIQGFYSDFSLSFLGPIYSLITLVQDLFSLLVIISVIFSLYRRFIQKVPRLDVDKHGKLDAAFILLLIMAIVVAMYGQNAAGFANNNFASHEFEVRPVSAFIGGLLFSESIIINVFSLRIFLVDAHYIDFWIPELSTILQASSCIKCYSKCVLCKSGSD